MPIIIENEHRFKSFSKFIWLFGLGLPLIVALRFLFPYHLMDVLIGVYGILLIGFFLFALFVAMPSYFYFTADSRGIKIKFRPFSFLDIFAPFTSDKISSVVIRNDDFTGYKIKNKFAGMRRSLVLYNNNRRTEVINISYLTIKEITELIRTLHRFQFKRTEGARSYTAIRADLESVRS